ncbi:hypothetical protein ACFL2R_02375 [Patescibacteria group bacterium]
MTVIKDYAKKILFGDRFEPIIKSLLEVDVYKYYMLYFIWTYYRFLEVTFALKNRTAKVRLADYVDLGDLQAQINYVRNLRIDEVIVAHLRSWNIFPEEFLQYLKTIVLPEVQIERTPDGQIDVRVTGKWMEVTLWETIILAIVNQLYARGYVEKNGIDCGQLMKQAEERLIAKVPTLNELTWPILLFGLRRRLSANWERRITEILLNEARERIAAVSNVQIAKEFGVPVGGTNAHELPMAVYALRLWDGKDAARNAQYEVIERLADIYPYDKRTILPDTFGSKQFIAGMSEEMARYTCGFRQDSGDPAEFARMVIGRYEGFEINPMEKTCFFSDGLNPQKMLKLNREFQDLILGGFGWGTNGTNDTGIIPNISLVMKLIWAADRYTVKLSDNIAKAMGPKKEVSETKGIFDYDVTLNKACTY